MVCPLCWRPARTGPAKIGQVQRIGIGQRRARLARRHHLAPGAAAPGPVEVARGVVALHSTDPASVFLAVHARTAPVPVDPIEHALYRERTLLRMHGMRRTMFVVEAGLAPVIQAACTDGVVERSRRQYAKLLADAGVGDVAWLSKVADQAAEALAAMGQATGAQLSAVVPALRTQLLLNQGKKYEARQNITSWVLFLLAAEGRIVRGRPLGSWTGSQYTWFPMTAWLPGGMPAHPAPAARAELARRWLARFGPGTEADLRWWTGWTAGQVRQALAEVRPVEVDLDGVTGLVLADDREPEPEPDPWVALLPALDSTPMGWAGRAWFLGEHRAAVFDRNGNIGPTVWCDGRIVGGWAQRPDGAIGYRLLEDIGREAAAAVEAAAGALTGWVGQVRVTPRFRTPLERELTAPAGRGGQSGTGSGQDST
jgi:hypothetical protein